MPSTPTPTPSPSEAGTSWMPSMSGAQGGINNTWSEFQTSLKHTGSALNNSTDGVGHNGTLSIGGFFVALMMVFIVGSICAYAFRMMVQNLSREGSTDKTQAWNRVATNGISLGGLAFLVTGAAFIVVIAVVGTLVSWL